MYDYKYKFRLAYSEIAPKSFNRYYMFSFAITGNLSPVVAAILMPVSSVSVVAFATFVTRLAGRIKLK